MTRFMANLIFHYNGNEVVTSAIIEYTFGPRRLLVLQNASDYFIKKIQLKNCKRRAVSGTFYGVLNES